MSFGHHIDLDLDSSQIRGHQKKKKKKKKKKKSRTVISIKKPSKSICDFALSRFYLKKIISVTFRHDITFTAFDFMQQIKKI